MSTNEQLGAISVIVFPEVVASSTPWPNRAALSLSLTQEIIELREKLTKVAVLTSGRALSMNLVSQKWLPLSSTSLLQA